MAREEDKYNGPEIDIGGENSVMHENSGSDTQVNPYIKILREKLSDNSLDDFYIQRKKYLVSRLVPEARELYGEESFEEMSRELEQLEAAYSYFISSGGMPAGEPAEYSGISDIKYGTVSETSTKGNIYKIAVKICPKCGIEYENSTKFCGKCGHELVLMQCVCGEVFRKNEDGSFDKFCVKCRKINPLENAKQAEELRIAEEKRQKQENARKHREYINSLKAGDIIVFGSYPFEADGTEKPVEWRILEKKNSTALLICEYCLDARRFDSSRSYWEGSEIRQWLNNEFRNVAFKDYERNAKVFLLSRDEAEIYFKNKNDMIAYPTPYAKGRGAYTDGGSCWWWLRSSWGINDVFSVAPEGSFVRDLVNCDNIAVRPALKINLNNL